MRSCSESGQATVEAAVMLPVLFVIFGLFMQPAILLYNKSVMTAAAAEGCRLVATNTASEAAVKAYVKRRLGGIPHASMFHIGKNGSWKVTCSGPNEKGTVSVKIVNKSRPLPLFGVVAGLGKSIDKNGNVKQTVKVKSSSLPTWTYKTGKTASDWIGEWK